MIARLFAAFVMTNCIVYSWSLHAAQQSPFFLVIVGLLCGVVCGLGIAFGAEPALEEAE